MKVLSWMGLGVFFFVAFLLVGLEWIPANDGERLAVMIALVLSGLMVAPEVIWMAIKYVFGG